jgi:hypothetical protein
VRIFVSLFVGAHLSAHSRTSAYDEMNKRREMEKNMELQVSAMRTTGVRRM